MLGQVIRTFNHMCVVLILLFFKLYSPDVEFCGYTIPHPSESKMNIRIQTYGVFPLFY